MNNRTNARRLAAGVTALSLAFVVLGCNGDGDDGDGAATEPVETTTPVPDTTAGAGGTTVVESTMEAAEVDMVDISFEPADITVPVGATVVWTNQDVVDHTSTADDGTWDSGVVASGETFEHTFDEPGTYSYLCEIHPSVMRGTVTVEE